MLRKLLASLLLVVMAALPVSAQITIPNTFTPLSIISSSDFNENFTELGTKSLNRTGGTITGNVSVSSGVTIDGADISAYLAGGKLTTASTASDSADIAGGLTIGTGNVALVNTAGKIPALTTTYFASVDGSALTGLDASQLASGTIATARLGSGSASSSTFLRGDSTWQAINLASLDASSLTSGTVPSARMSGSYTGITGIGTLTVGTVPAARISAGTFGAGSYVITGGLTAGSGGVGIIDTSGKIPAISSTYFASLSAANLTSIPAANLSGTIASAVQDNITRTGTVVSGTWSSTLGAVSGASLTSLNASELSSGTIPNARITDPVRVWAMVTVSGGTPTVTADSFVASITDGGVGDYTLNFDSALSTANYGAVCTVRTSTARANCHIITQSTTSLRVFVMSDSAETNVDASFNVVIVE